MVGGQFEQRCKWEDSQCPHLQKKRSGWRRRKHFHPVGQTEYNVFHPLGYFHHPNRGAIHLPPRLVSLVPVLVLVLVTGEVVVMVRGDEGGRPENVQYTHSVSFAA